MMWTSYLLVLALARLAQTDRRAEYSSALEDFYRKFDLQQKGESSAELEKNKPTCRYTWAWESKIYGDACLPAKTSISKSERQTSVTRHARRHKNKDFDHSPSNSRHHNGRKSSETDDNESLPVQPVYEGFTKDNLYRAQMDAPLYSNILTVSLNDKPNHLMLQGPMGSPGAQGPMGKTGDPVRSF